MLPEQKQGRVCVRRVNGGSLMKDLQARIRTLNEDESAVGRV